MPVPRKIEIVNRKARYEYQFIDTYEAGISLTGTEIKSIRFGNANLRDAFCMFIGNELYIKNLYIAPYKEGSYANHDPVRERKLLLKKAELKKLKRRVDEKGMTIVPYKMYLNDRGIAKVEISLAQGKKSYDKRETIKERDTKRELDRARKLY
jgi:SsrA-binding protein